MEGGREEEKEKEKEKKKVGEVSTFWWLASEKRRRRGHDRIDGPGSYGIIYLTGRETKRTKHCRGVALQTELLGEKRRDEK